MTLEPDSSHAGIVNEVNHNRPNTHKYVRRSQQHRNVGNLSKYTYSVVRVALKSAVERTLFIFSVVIFCVERKWNKAIMNVTRIYIFRFVSHARSHGLSRS